MRLRPHLSQPQVSYTLVSCVLFLSWLLAVGLCLGFLRFVLVLASRLGFLFYIWPGKITQEFLKAPSWPTVDRAIFCKSLVQYQTRNNIDFAVIKIAFFGLGGSSCLNLGLWLALILDFRAFGSLTQAKKLKNIQKLGQIFLR